jgi:DNA processing protein
MDVDDLAGLVALTTVDGIGDARAYDLYSAFESVADLRSKPLEAFDAFHYVDAETHAELQALEPAIEETRTRFARHQEAGIDLVGIEDDRYPDAVRAHHAPLVLYARGAVDQLADPSVSVTGSRETNDDGRDWIRTRCRELAAAGVTVVSGGARGTDTAAHEGALAAAGPGATVVVLGTGVDTPYPPENAALFERVVDEGGLLLSHRPPEAGPTRHAFLDRNATISALSPGLVVVATDGSGGTMAQYSTATQQDRTVYVPPPGRGIAPDEGLEELRSHSDTTVLDATDDPRSVVDAIATESTASDSPSTPADGGQSRLTDWE